MNEQMYYINYQFGPLIAYEILVNDVLIDKDFRNGRPGPSSININLLKSGKQELKLRLFHIYKEKGGVIRPTDIDFLNKDLSIINIIESENNIKSTLIKKINLPKIEKDMPFIEYKCEFDVDIPYTLVGWGNSQNLSEWDEKKLEETVISKFRELRNILNKGEGAQFVKQLDFLNNEYFISNQLTEKEQQEYLANLINQFTAHKNIMPKIDNYKIKMLGNGRAVTLETVNPHGQGVLTAKNEEEKEIYLHHTILHIPKGSNEFQILRMSSYITGF
ncbi:hypothetical protein [Tenacibaculum sp. SDUM215027]|uniref:hypothetical protein n=1 Tax=Tenacibaculum sp. SDUM215027 TaxID=3422596 RepID=UPI003D3181FF